MLELEIDGNLIYWTRYFLTNQKLELVIDNHNHQEKDVETGIPQGSPVSPILFLIYISGVFKQVESQLSGVVSLSFVDNLGFIALEKLVREISKTLEKVEKTVLQLGEENAATYNTAKTELVLFSRVHQKRLHQ